MNQNPSITPLMICCMSNTSNSGKYPMQMNKHTSKKGCLSPTHILEKLVVQLRGWYISTMRLFLWFVPPKL